MLNKKYGFKFTDTVKKLPGYIVSWSVFIFIICVLKLIIPTTLQGRLIQILILALYGIISFGIYAVINYYNGNLKAIINIRRNRKWK